MAFQCLFQYTIDFFKILNYVGYVWRYGEFNCNILIIEFFYSMKNPNENDFQFSYLVYRFTLEPLPYYSQCIVQEWMMMMYVMSLHLIHLIGIKF